MILYQLIIQSLVFFYRLFGNLGLAIVFFTFLFRLLLLPLSWPFLHSVKKMQQIAPELAKLKKKYRGDRRRFQEEQLKLLQKQGVNPASGCFFYLFQLLLFAIPYRAFQFFLAGEKIDGFVVNTRFLWLDLTKPDPLFLLPLLASLSQFLLGKITPPPSSLKQKGRALKEVNYLFPLLIFFSFVKLPSGLAVYWLATTFFSFLQQYYFQQKHGGK